MENNNQRTCTPRCRQLVTLDMWKGQHSAGIRLLRTRHLHFVNLLIVTIADVSTPASNVQEWAHLPSIHPFQFTHGCKTAQYPCEFCVEWILQRKSFAYEFLPVQTIARCSHTSSWWNTIETLGSIPIASNVASISIFECLRTFGSWGRVSACHPTIEYIMWSSGVADCWSLTQFDKAPR